MWIESWREAFRVHGEPSHRSPIVQQQAHFQLRGMKYFCTIQKRQIVADRNKCLSTSQSGSVAKQFGSISQSTEVHRQQTVWIHRSNLRTGQNAEICMTGQSNTVARNPPEEGKGEEMRWERREGGSVGNLTNLRV
jgi:hypothetical protein